MICTNTIYPYRSDRVDIHVGPFRLWSASQIRESNAASTIRSPVSAFSGARSYAIRVFLCFCATETAPHKPPTEPRLFSPQFVDPLGL